MLISDVNECCNTSTINDRSENQLCNLYVVIVREAMNLSLSISPSKEMGDLTTQGTLDLDGN